MDQVTIKDISNYKDKEITIKGWLYNKRSSGKIHFLLVRDGTGIVQSVVEKGKVTDEEFEMADHISQESSIIVKGLVRADPRSPIGYEISVTEIRLIQEAYGYPITPKDHGIAFLMDHRHLWLRSLRQHAILKIRSRIEKSIRDFFDSKNFTLIDAPIFTPSSCEGTTTLFETEYFGRKVYLSQSGQLYMEAAAMAFGKVYCFGPTFRAEKSKTRRHLTEFWMVEPEMAYAELEDAMELAEDLVITIVKDVLSDCSKELDTLKRDKAKLKQIKKPFPRITYKEAVNLLKEKGVDIVEGDDFGGDEETILSNRFGLPLFVHHYPLALKAFYMKGDPKDPSLALCMDMLAPEGYGEIIGGGQREDNLDTLRKRIKTAGLDEKDFDWYLDLRRYGSVPHAGFGLGLERTVAWICGLHHVRETIPFPRTIERVSP
ncbi:MAG: asparagine--tRNA ligase [Spirochaetes bacterium]|nr:MAG: asparagine--tRNA ligase [Spirochaetota bacterium]